MKILLISSKAKELQAIADNFSTKNCSVITAVGVKPALKLLASQQFNIVVTLAKLSNVSGIELFKAIQKKFPRIARFIVNNTNEDIALAASQVAHCQLSLPIDLLKLKGSIATVGHNNASITQKSIVLAVKNAKTLPSPPKVYLQLNHILQSKNVDSEKIADIISQDPALAAKVLQFSNSAFIAKGNPINSITEAITRMGVEMLSCIVMTAELFVENNNSHGYSIEDEQKHSLVTAKLASSLVKPELKQSAMIAGLLHDIGKLVLYELDEKLSRDFFNERNDKVDNILLEQKMFNCDHCHVGAYLLHTWSFPYPLIEAISAHHTPEKLLSKTFGIAQAVYVADKLLREIPLDPSFIKHYKLDKTIDLLTQRAQKILTA